MWDKINQWGKSVPFKLHWFFVFFTVVIVPFLTRGHPVLAQRGEWYPFSNFPMYSTFEKTAYYVYVTDLHDQPVGTSPTFGIWPTAIKKAYDLLLKEEIKRLKSDAAKSGTKYKKHIYEMSGEECRPAGDAMLKRLRENSLYPEEAKKHDGYRLYQVDITLDDDGRIVKKTKMVGEIK